MPIVNCPRCGAKTNTAICAGWWDVENREKAKCTGKIVDGKYEKGCGYETASDFDRKFVDGLLKKN